MNLPKNLHGAYHCFNVALQREYQTTVTPRMYLRLLEKAQSRSAEHQPLKLCRTSITLTFDGKRVACVYDPLQGGALVSVLPRQRTTQAI